MRVVVSISDAIGERADELAASLGVSRSKLVELALRQYQQAGNGERRRIKSTNRRLTSAINRVCDEADTGLDPAFEVMQRQLLASSQW